jgi:RecG-like helicase
MAEDEKVRRLGERFKRTPEQLAEDIKNLELAKEKMTQNSEELDKNLKHFHDLLDPILDPNTGQPLCWVRRPSQKEWEEMAPAELMQYQDTPNDVPKEVMEKYKYHQFDMMSKLIAKPQHDANWWRENTDLVFQEMFQIYLLDVYRKLGIMVGNF